MTCQDCEKAAKVPHWCIYQRGCAGCEARMLGQSPACFAHVENMKRAVGRKGRAECATKPTQEDLAQVARINAELHRFGQLQNRVNIGNAVKNLFGFEAWEMVKTEAARLEKEAREESGIPPC